MKKFFINLLKSYETFYDKYADVCFMTAFIIMVIMAMRLGQQRDAMIEENRKLLIANKFLCNELGIKHIEVLDIPEGCKKCN